MLRVEQLEDRSNPAPLIPGWDGAEKTVLGHFNTDILLDTAVVALAGGSCRTMVFDGATGDVLLNEISFNPDFRGGGVIKTIPYVLGTGHDVSDRLVVVPGFGGGPRVVEFSFDTSSGVMRQTESYFAPYPESFRGGLQVSYGDIDGDRHPEAFFLPGIGGGPQLVAIDMRTHETELSIWVGDPKDRSGDTHFDPLAGTVATPVGLGIVTQYGVVRNGRVPTTIWSLDGRDITASIRYTDPILQSPESNPSNTA